MTAEQLIKELQKFDKDKIVVLCDSSPDGVGWDNVGELGEDPSTIMIFKDRNGLFQDN